MYVFCMCIYTGWIKKTGISGVLADFGIFFFQTAANIIENFKILKNFWLLQGGWKKIFPDLLEIEQTFAKKV